MSIEMFDDLVVFVNKIQKANPEFFRSPIDSKYGTVPGIVQQFQQLNLSPEHRDKGEVMVVYYDRNPNPTDDQQFLAVAQWFDRETSFAIDEPIWFTQRKADIAAAREKMNAGEEEVIEVSGEELMQAIVEEADDAA